MSLKVTEWTEVSMAGLGSLLTLSIRSDSLLEVQLIVEVIDGPVLLISRMLFCLK